MKVAAYSVFLCAAFHLGLEGAHAQNANVSTAETTAAEEAASLARQVVIRRTDYGVPHIRAENLRAGAFGMAYVQLQDYGRRVPEDLIEARGELARYKGREHLDSDFVNRWLYARAIETWSRLPEDVRAIYEGYAAGVTYYVRLHPEEFPIWRGLEFTGYDVLSRDIREPSLWRINKFLRQLEQQTEHISEMRADRVQRATPWALASRGAEPIPAADGSNAWALAPGRTKSGHAILMRNPHLSWNAGYYEAQLTVPGEFNFYGDFRIGGPFGTIAGFNEHVAWATTNNYPVLDRIYTLEVDPDRPGRYLFNRASLPIRREQVTVQFRNGDGLGVESRTFLSTPLGPVIHRDRGKIYVYRQPGRGEYHGGAQWLRMLRADSLGDWKAALSMRADRNSNYTYADTAGNIFYVWNASMPQFVHSLKPEELTENPIAIPVSRTSDTWTELVPFDELPQLKNPRGGYVHNSNDSFHYTNLNEVMRADDFPVYFNEPEFDLRSQLSYQLIGGNERLSIEQVIQRKHSMRMLLADRVKPDLIAAVRASEDQGRIAGALDLIRRWDNTAAADSRGSVLFVTWWKRYEAMTKSIGKLESPFAEPWTPDAPTTTPRGLAAPALAVEAFVWAIKETDERWGRWDVSWGTVHRARRGEVDVPIGGCSGSLGCYRVVDYHEAKDGKLVADGGDGWVLAVVMSDPPRAYSILAYGESNRPESPYYDDQLELFARGEMKRIAFTEEQIREQLIREYHPGEELVTSD